MRYISLCSGIEAATRAWEPLGWTPVAFSEIAPFPSAVLAHHYPDVPNLGDMTKVDWSQYAGAADLVCGGTPCQSFSVAGLRKGLADPRGNLALEFLRAVDAIRPEWVVWENVPGVLSSGSGRDFGTFLGALGQLGYGFAYRVLDAQYVRVDGFGRAVPQRRRRVFVVGCAGGAWQRAGAVLLERESLSWGAAPQRGEGETVASTFTARATSGGWSQDIQLAAGGYMVAEMYALQERADGVASGPQGKGYSDSGAAYTLEARQTPQAVAYAITTGQTGANGCNISKDVAPTLDLASPPAVCFAENQQGQVRMMEVASSLNGGGGKPGQVYPAVLYPEVAHSLTAEGFDASEDGTGRGTPIVVMAQGSANAEVTEDYAPTLTCTHDGPPIVMAPAFSKRPGQQIATREDGTSFALTAGEPPRVCVNWRVRRLTARECERLQGFPDDYTLVPYRNGMAKDGPRYKAIGNSWAVNAARWLGVRIEMVREVAA